MQTVLFIVLSILSMTLSTLAYGATHSDCETVFLAGDYVLATDTTKLKFYDTSIEKIPGTPYVGVTASEPKPVSDDYRSYVAIFQQSDGAEQFQRKAEIWLGSGKMISSMDLSKSFGEIVPLNTFATLRLTTANSYIFNIFQITVNTEETFSVKVIFMEVMETPTATSLGYELATHQFLDERLLVIKNKDANEVRAFDLGTMQWDPRSFSLLERR